MVRRRNRGSLKMRCLFLMGIVLIVLSCSYIYNTIGPPNESTYSTRRHLLAVEHCQLSRLRNTDFDEYAEGVPAVLVYCIALFVLFVGIATVTDELFVPALMIMSERMDLSEDVAGATLMASASSAPELFTNVADSIGEGTSVGIGTIVGSAMFNILVIIACTGILAADTLIIDWKPLIRDCFFYCCSIGLLLYFLTNGGAEERGRVTWEEGLVMFLFYFLYVLFMKYNQFFMALMDKTKDVVSPRWKENVRMWKESEQAGNENKSGNGDGIEMQEPKDNAAAGNSDPPPANAETNEDEEEPVGCCGKFISVFIDAWMFVFSCTIPDVNSESIQDKLDACDDPEEKESLTKAKLKKEKWYVVAFVNSIIWIMIICYGMVWLAEKCGCIMGIPPKIMGATVLAAGTSIPDALGSIEVAYKGMGDMAVANAIGSNVFDILIGLGLPWFVRGAAAGKVFDVDMDGIQTWIIFLFSTVIVLVIAFIISGWRLGKTFGFCLLVLYVGFIVFVILHYVYL